MGVTDEIPSNVLLGIQHEFCANVQIIVGFKRQSQDMFSGHRGFQFWHASIDDNGMGIIVVARPNETIAFVFTKKYPVHDMFAMFRTAKIGKNPDSLRFGNIQTNEIVCLYSC